jgi:hypothetical protein
MFSVYFYFRCSDDMHDDSVTFEPDQDSVWISFVEVVVQ